MRIQDVLCGQRVRWKQIARGDALKLSDGDLGQVISNNGSLVYVKFDKDVNRNQGNWDGTASLPCDPRNLEVL